MTVYPNPTAGIFTVSVLNIKDKYDIEIYNEIGEKVLIQILHSTQDDNLIDLSNQPNGVYFYRVITNEGGVIGSGKIAVQK